MAFHNVDGIGQSRLALQKPPQRHQWLRIRSLPYLVINIKTRNIERDGIAVPGADQRQHHVECRSRTARGQKSAVAHPAVRLHFHIGKSLREGFQVLPMGGGFPTIEQPGLC
ncbi:hypothetical protein D9M70_593600 [compost metagenome]